MCIFILIACAVICKGSYCVRYHSTICIHSVPDFEATKYLVTNGEFLAFVNDCGYSRRELWTEEGTSICPGCIIKYMCVCVYYAHLHVT